MADYAPSNSAPLSDWVFQLFAAVNQQRLASYSSTHLRLRLKLNEIAQKYADDKTTPADAVQALSDFGATSEKAAFISTEADSVDAAINSLHKVSAKDPARKAMRNPDFHFAGVGTNTGYWVVVFSSDLN
ncbi:hypothetical protein EC988_002548 [Linderina pennispora]|nr:hypothetical protein EC988_002548 [Linderina pennispora]